MILTYLFDQQLFVDNHTNNLYNFSILKLYI
nr:MAG TPA: hypothetical protein [Caudoviricetes sp.]